MKLLVDSQVFDNQKFGGISRYFTELIKRSTKEHQINHSIIYTQNFHLSELFSELDKEPLRSKISAYFKYGFSKRKRSKRFHDLNKANSLNQLKNQDFDVFIPTYYDPYFLDYLDGKPFVLTVYDMIHEIMKGYINPDQQLIENKRLLIEKADKVIAISKSTKNDILALYPHIDDQKIEVVYLSESITINEDVKLNLPKRYILFVGNRGDYKNFNFFIESITPLLKEDENLQVVCAGGGQFRNSEKRYLKSLEIETQIIQNDFKDNELFHYYNQALCFVFPSMYEGFGIPVLEAMKAECPVVLANHSSFPEVAGDAGVYFELGNKNDLKEKISQLINDESLRRRHIEKGKIQAQKFSWDKMANESIDIYKSVII